MPAASGPLANPAGDHEATRSFNFWSFNTDKWTPSTSEWSLALGFVQPEEKVRILKFRFKEDQKVVACQYECAWPTRFCSFNFLFCFRLMECGHCAAARFDWPPTDKGGGRRTHQAALYCRETDSNQEKQADSGEKTLSARAYTHCLTQSLTH